MLPCSRARKEIDHSKGHFLGRTGNGRRLLAEGGGFDVCAKKVLWQGKGQCLLEEEI